MGLLYSVIQSTLLALRRECPKCHHSQFTPRGKAQEAVKCAKCGAAVPPRKTREGR